MTAEPQALKTTDAVARSWVESVSPAVQPYLRLMRLDGPMAAEFAKIDPGQMVEGYVAIERVFPRELAGNTMFREAVGAKLALLREVGAAEAVRRSV